MSIIFPPRIEPGKDLRQVLQEIIDYVKSIVPTSSDSIHVEHTSDGCIISAVDNSTAAEGNGLLHNVGNVITDSGTDDGGDSE